MAYTINVPVDWLYPGAKIWTTAIVTRTGFDGPPAVFKQYGWVHGFTISGFYYHYRDLGRLYHAKFSDIGKSVFETEEDAERALKEETK